jgi:hypothetical protein
LSSFDSIDENAFLNCNSLTNGDKLFKITFDSDRNKKGIIIADHAFDGCKKISSVMLPKSGELSFGNDAFKGCSNLKEVSLPDNASDINLRSVGFEAFKECSSLTEIDLSKTKFVSPDSVIGA